MTVNKITNPPSQKDVIDKINEVIDNLGGGSLPSQTGQSGKFLTTDGTDASWGNLPVATSSTVGVVKPDNASIRISNDGTISAICRNVGEIIQSSLPLTDAGLHLLDGSLLQYGIYKEFIDYIADLYTDNPSANYFCTEALWQSSVSTYGSCGKFVYDSVNNTVRLPKVSDILQGTTDLTALGDLVEAGLPNITGTLSAHGNRVSWYASSGAISLNSLSSYPAGATSDPYMSANGLTIDASRSSSIYGNSSTVQPQTIKVLYYIVIANSTKTDIQVDINQVATDLNGKADTDLTNTTDTGKILMGGMALPGNSAITLTLGASGSTYTAPANGYFLIIYSMTGNSWCNCYNDSSFGIGIYNTYSTSTADGARAWCPVKKNDICKISYQNIGNANLKFIYAQGSESEAS